MNKDVVTMNNGKQCLIITILEEDLIKLKSELGVILNFEIINPNINGDVQIFYDETEDGVIELSPLHKHIGIENIKESMKETNTLYFFMKEENNKMRNLVGFTKEAIEKLKIGKAIILESSLNFEITFIYKEIDE